MVPANGFLNESDFSNQAFSSTKIKLIYDKAKASRALDFITRTADWATVEPDWPIIWNTQTKHYAIFVLRFSLRFTKCSHLYFYLMMHNVKETGGFIWLQLTF